MALRKCVPSANPTSIKIQSLTFSKKENGKVTATKLQKNPTEADVDLDLREVYFLILHFLSAGPCQRTCGQLWKELLEHRLLPRRYHSWYSRSGVPSGDENDDGISFPLSYAKLLERHPHIGKDHLVKLLKQLVLCAENPSRTMVSGNMLNASSVPTLLGTGSFSLLGSDRHLREHKDIKPPSYMRWPHRLADQVHGLGLREIGGGFPRHHRAPSTHAACYAIAKPSTMVQKMQNIKRVRGHRNSVYCAIFDRSGRYVITGSDDRLVKIWSMDTAYCLASCRGHEGDITDLAVSFNNVLVASASNDCIIRVWRLPDGLPLSVLRGHLGAVTAITFNPRPGAFHQLLSSSDDGTCHIWDARHSLVKPRIYVPKPPESASGRSNNPSSSTPQPSHQIFCCAFNASGTIFVTGSSDTLARVWNACKSSTENSEQPIHEIDVLAGHENDVNYVQFSGCAVVPQASTSDALKEESLPKFRSTWVNHDNIVTCSRDGSAIIWIPRSRRSHGRNGRWVRSYHLKVPPPPMPPQPPRGGPRQRILPTPRGVNMIAWSLDNRFVLAAIMDCRICVWNAVDGSLVHSLTGHSDSTYVLDVHPFNPRIAMSAGYDGKTIVWDIWEGAPIFTYEIGPFKLVDGKFSPDGTSIILSDDVGQLYILNTGQGESQKDAKFDQFFLGDYRPLVRDTHGGILDQETQLPPYRRNIQDLLCDSGMIPYPEPYQSMYQKRRLGALGLEWSPSSLRLAVGVDFSLDPEFQMVPIVDLDTLVDPLPGFVDVVDWEPEADILSDDNDSEYLATEDYSSGGDQVSLHSDLDEPECSSQDTEDEEESHIDNHRRSKRRKQKAEVEIMTSSGRRVKRKNLDGSPGALIRSNGSRKLQNGQIASKKKSSSKSRPRRAAARNALHLFSRITGTSADGDIDLSDADSFESGSTLPSSSFASEGSDVSLQNEWYEDSKGKEITHDGYFVSDQTSALPKPHSDAPPIKRRLILKLPKPDASKQISGLRCDENLASVVAGPSSGIPQNSHGSDRISDHQDYGNINGADGDDKERINPEHPTLPEHHLVSWGGAKARTSKKLKMAEPLPTVLDPGLTSVLDQHLKSENIDNSPSRLERAEDVWADETAMPREDDPIRTVVPPRASSDNIENQFQLKESGMVVGTKLRIKTTRLPKDQGGPSRQVLPSPAEDASGNMIVCREPYTENFPFRDHVNPCMENKYSNGLPNSGHLSNGDASRFISDDSVRPEASEKNFADVVYHRLRSSRSRSNPEEASTSNVDKSNLSKEDEMPIEESRRVRSIRLRSSTRDLGTSANNLRSEELQEPSDEPSFDAGTASPKSANSPEGWESGYKISTRTRSTRNKKGSNYHVAGVSPPRKPTKTVKSSWLMLAEHEEGHKYIPQLGDEVVYLRQGHQEYLNQMHSRNPGPWDIFNENIRAVECCWVQHLEYSNYAGSGDSCCKMTLEFSDPASDVVGKSFKLTLTDMTTLPDFLVEKSWYDASIARKWTTRDKCRVWWRDDREEDGGKWWEGRILQVKPKSLDFPDSPWESYAVKYKSDPPETLQHSPWELHDIKYSQCEQPHIDDDIREKLILALSKLEQSGRNPRDFYGVRKLEDVSQKTNFMNRFPVPLSPKLIKARLEKNYYRSLDAMKHDVEVVLSNGKSYLGGNAEQSTKMKRLSDWFAKTLSSP